MPPSGLSASAVTALWGFCSALYQIVLSDTNQWTTHHWFRKCSEVVWLKQLLVSSKWRRWNPPSLTHNAPKQLLSDAAHSSLTKVLRHRTFIQNNGATWKAMYRSYIQNTHILLNMRFHLHKFSVSEKQQRIHIFAFCFLKLNLQVQPNTIQSESLLGLQGIFSSELSDWSVFFLIVQSNGFQSLANLSTLVLWSSKLSFWFFRYNLGSTSSIPPTTSCW